MTDAIGSGGGFVNWHNLQTESILNSNESNPGEELDNQIASGTSPGEELDNQIANIKGSDERIGRNELLGGPGEQLNLRIKLKNEIANDIFGLFNK